MCYNRINTVAGETDISAHNVAPVGAYWLESSTWLRTSSKRNILDDIEPGRKSKVIMNRDRGRKKPRTPERSYLY